ncbi:MAG: terminase family protein [Cyanobacteria bacterium P01_D01_bin.36]
MSRAVANMPVMQQVRKHQKPEKRQAALIPTFPETFKPNPGGQQRFHDLVGINPPQNCKERWLWTRGGVGSGKSFGIGAAFACSRAKYDPESRGLITANSYGQLETSTLVALAEFCRAFNIPLEPTANIPRDSPEWADETARRIAARRLCTLFGAPVLALSADAFTGTTERAQERGRGLQIRWAWADEFAYADGSAFNTLNTRLGRGGSGILKGLGVITSSINKNNPYNWAYELFDAPNRSEKQVEKFVSIPLSTFENIHLDNDYIDAQAAALTDELYRIEILGEYATVTVGRIFNTFNRTIHALYGDDSSLASYTPGHALHLSFDFNVDPGTALAAQLIDGELRIIKEFWVRNTDTFEVSNEVCQWLTSSVRHKKNIYIYGDSSGKSRRTSSTKTDWNIVWDAFRKYGITASRRYGESNPPVKDSINSVKIAFKSGKVFINGDTCSELIKDLESLKWKNDEIDKSDGMRSHLADELRYMVDRIWPYRGTRTKSTRQNATPLKGIVH